MDSEAISEANVKDFYYSVQLLLLPAISAA